MCVPLAPQGHEPSTPSAGTGADHPEILSLNICLLREKSVKALGKKNLTIGLATDKSQHLECPNPKPVGVQINVSELN